MFFDTFGRMIIACVHEGISATIVAAPTIESLNISLFRQSAKVFCSNKMCKSFEPPTPCYREPPPYVVNPPINRRVGGVSYSSIVCEISLAGFSQTETKQQSYHLSDT